MIRLAKLRTSQSTGTLGADSIVHHQVRPDIFKSEGSKIY